MDTATKINSFHHLERLQKWLAAPACDVVCGLYLVDDECGSDNRNFARHATAMEGLMSCHASWTRLCLSGFAETPISKEMIFHKNISWPHLNQNCSSLSGPISDAPVYRLRCSGLASNREADFPLCLRQKSSLGWKLLGQTLNCKSCLTF